MSFPAVIVHGLADASEALAPGLPVTLLSAEGAALFAGCLWWRALVETARREHPATPIEDILDCADSPGRAMAALRIGQRTLVLSPRVAGFEAVATAAAAQGSRVLSMAPPALDLAKPGAARRLRAWLAGPPAPPG